MHSVKRIRIEILKHRDTDLWLAISDDLPGLVVHGQSHGELEDRIEPAILALFEADGYKVLDIETEKRNLDLPEGFEMPEAYIASASLKAMAA